MPKYSHNCRQCIYLDTITCENTAIGGSNTFDLYYCLNEPTVVARFGNEPSEYTSGIGFHRINPVISFGVVLANKHGYDVSRYGEF